MEVFSYIAKAQVLHINNKVMIQIWQFCQKSKLRGNQLAIYKVWEGAYLQKCRLSQKNEKKPANLHKNNKSWMTHEQKKRRNTKITKKHTENNRSAQRMLWFPVCFLKKEVLIICLFFFPLFLSLTFFCY